MKTKTLFKHIAFIFSCVMLCAAFSSCENMPKRAYLIDKTDDNNWTSSGIIQCDSVNMISETHAIYWVDGGKFNLYARSFIKVKSNPYYKHY